MTAYTAAVTHNGPPMKEERIEDIHDLTYLRKYACQRYRYCGQDWYLKCVDCAKKCKAGLQAMVILDNETKAAEKKPDPPVDKKRQEIIDIFESADPVKYMLEHSGNIKPQSVYAKVSVMKKNYPDLEKKYHMLEKFRFLYQMPYASMKIPDILAELYPSEGEDKKKDISAEKKQEKSAKPDRNKEPEKEDFGGKYAGLKKVDANSGAALKHEVKELPPTQMAPNSRIYAVKPELSKDPAKDSIGLGNQENADDCISLEDFLEQTDANLKEHFATEVKEFVMKEDQKQKGNTPTAMQDSAGKNIRPGVASEIGGLISELERKKDQLQNQIQQIDEQIKAARTTMELMRGFVIF